MGFGDEIVQDALQNAATKFVEYSFVDVQFSTDIEIFQQLDTFRCPKQTLKVSTANQFDNVFRRESRAVFEKNVGDQFMHLSKGIETFLN